MRQIRFVTIIVFCVALAGFAAGESKTLSTQEEEDLYAANQARKSANAAAYWKRRNDLVKQFGKGNMAVIATGDGNFQFFTSYGRAADIATLRSDEPGMEGAFVTLIGSESFTQAHEHIGPFEGVELEDARVEGSAKPQPHVKPCQEVMATRVQDYDIPSVPTDKLLNRTMNCPRRCFQFGRNRRLWCQLHVMLRKGDKEGYCWLFLVDTV